MIKSLKNSLYIFKIDWLRIFKSPLTLIIITGLMLLPSFYAWFNIKSMWDPYGNASNLPIGVYSDDIGYTIEGTKINVGNEIIENLKTDKNLKWIFPNSYNELVDNVNNGTYYGSIYIPSDFSKNLTGFLYGNYNKPHIEYRVNEKINAISPKMTEAGAEGVSSAITYGFNKVISETVLSTFNQLGTDFKNNIPLFYNIFDSIDEMQNSAEKFNTFLNSLNKFNIDFDTYEDFIYNLDAKTINNSLDSFAKKINELNFQLENILSNNTLKDFYNLLYSLQNSKNEFISNFINSHKDIKEFSTNAQYFWETTLPSFKENINNLNIHLQDNLPTFEEKVTTNINSIQTTLPKIKSTLNEAYNFSANTWNEGYEFLNKAQTTTDNIKNNKTFEQISDYLINDFINGSSFIAKPVETDVIRMYPIENYGSASTPFYTALCLWVGAVLLTSLLSTHFHNDTKKKITDREIFIGRLLTFLSISVVQALIVSLGNIYLLGIYVQDPLYFIIFSIFIALAFNIIVYTIVNLFGNVGKAIAVILLVLSISGGGGNFPIQVSGEFFQTINPLLPFTHAVNLLRETIGGIYIPTVYTTISVLAFYSILFLLLGTFGAKYINPIVKKLQKKTEESHILH